MADEATGTGSEDVAAIRAAYGTARDLLEQAERDAEALRADAARYAKERQAEADLLVAKCRRLLAAAEARASVIIATAHALPTLTGDEVIDLDALAHVIAPGATVLGRGGALARLDDLLASAFAHAVDDAFPEDVGSHEHASA